jgi:hypothetical protein
MPQQLSPFVEERIVAFALGHPGYGPKRIASELRRERWGGIIVSHNGVWRCLRRHGLNTRAKRLSLVAGYAAPYQPPRAPEPGAGTSRFVRRVAAELAAAGWQLERILSDNGGEFRASLAACRRGLSWRPHRLAASKLVCSRIARASASQDETRTTGTGTSLAPNRSLRAVSSLEVRPELIRHGFVTGSNPWHEQLNAAVE